MLQKLVNIAAVAVLFVGIALAFQAVKGGFLKTFGPFDEVKVVYKWMDPRSGDRKCVAKAPGEEATLCDKKSKEELNEYKLLWQMPEKALAQVAYSRKE